ncbi:MAG: phosphodiester glycosidase family protein [Oscillospiraceae bacterium]|nr:phosphodiester glycosidase family protein [Oscillospiraceae bacterium]
MRHRTKSALLLLPLCAFLLLTGFTSSVEKDYQDAEALLAEGNYEAASAKFRELGSYEEASRLLMYSRAASAAESGDYDTARRAFSALDSFRDAPEMLRYYEGREAETEGRIALSSEDYAGAIRELKNAAEIYGALPGFRDTTERASACLSALYEQGRVLLGAARYTEARDLFSALGSYSDSAGLNGYCEACLLEAGGSSLAAAERFSALPGVLDAAARADANREQVYQQALSLSAGGQQEASINLFNALGSYRDAREQRDSTIRLLLDERLRNGEYDGVSLLLDTAAEAMSLQRVDDAAQRARFEPFLDGFLEAYLHFSAGSMDSWSGYYGMLPYVDPNGALEYRFRQVTMIGSYSHNSNFIYYGSEFLDLYLLRENFYIAYVRASASVNQPRGPVEITRTFRLLVHDTEGGLIVEAMDDCLYGTSNPSGRLTVTCPLPNGELPADEDGDGILVVDVMKKGFQGTMIIVLDPSRVFLGGPGFFGGNGMILEDLVARYDALGGINAGGFIDEDGAGSGGFPEGLTVLEGEAYLWADSGASAAFDNNNVLHVGFFKKEEVAELGIRDCASFGPQLIVDGQPEYGSYMESGINPRTAIGQRADGAVLMLCIDGRQLRSIGASFADIRDVMLDFGAVNACSLDGGSSTVMYYNGEYLNWPSSASGTSRYLPNAFLIRR